MKDIEYKPLTGDPAGMKADGTKLLNAASDIERSL